MSFEQVRAAELNRNPLVALGLGVVLTATLSAGSCDVATTPAPDSTASNTSTGSANHKPATTAAAPKPTLAPGHGCIQDMKYRTPDADAYDANGLLPFGRQLIAASNQTRTNGNLPANHGLTFRFVCAGAETSNILTALWQATGRGSKSQAEDAAYCFPYFWKDNRQNLDEVIPDPQSTEKDINKKYDEHKRDPNKGGAATDCSLVLANAIRGNKEVSGISVKIAVPPGATTKDRAV